MTSPKTLLRLIPLIAIALTAYAKKAPLELAGVECQTPPPLHCPDTGCPGTVTSQTGDAVEAGTGRKFFLD